jgi:predicted kinase
LGKVILICGKIGSGKTTYAKRIEKQLNAVIITQDELMYGLFGTELYKNDHEKYDKYCSFVEEYVKRKAGEIAKAGAVVICENGYWSYSERDGLRKFYADMGVSCELHYIDTTEEQRAKNIKKRNDAVLRKKCNETFMQEEDIHHYFEIPDNDEIDFRVEYSNFTK